MELSFLEPKMLNNRKRILFMPTTASLAHVGRLAALASTLRREEVETFFACDESVRSLLPPETKFFGCTSLSQKEFLQRLDQGQLPFDEDSLARQVQEDLVIFRHTKPDLVVGDFRLSLIVSAPLAGVPFMNVTNAHWSPWAESTFDIPQAPNRWPLRWLPYGFIARIFRTAAPLLLKSGARCFNRLSRRYGMNRTFEDLRDVYTSGDFVAYADIPDLVPTQGAPNHHRYIGGVIWDPPLPQPTWWNNLPSDRPVVYVSAGSTGRTDLLPHILKVLDDLNTVAVVSTSGRYEIPTIPGRVYSAPYLPGSAISQRASLVINNGGSASCYQALAQATPVLGVAANIDQSLFMDRVERAGAGRRVMAAEALQFPWKETIQETLRTSVLPRAANRLSRIIAQHTSQQLFSDWVRDIFGLPAGIVMGSSGPRR